MESEVSTTQLGIARAHLQGGIKQMLANMKLLMDAEDLTMYERLDLSNKVVQMNVDIAQVLAVCPGLISDPEPEVEEQPVAPVVSLVSKAKISAEAEQFRPARTFENGVPRCLEVTYSDSGFRQCTRVFLHQTTEHRFT